MEKVINNLVKEYYKEKITIDFKDKIQVVIDGIGDVSTPEEMIEKLVVDNIGNIYRYIGETNEQFVQGALYLVEEE